MLKLKYNARFILYDLPCKEIHHRERMTVNHDVTGSSPVGGAKNSLQLIGVDDAEGPPVPIPNTEVKLNGAEDSALAMRCENREMPILVASFPLSNEADF